MSTKENKNQMKYFDEEEVSTRRSIMDDVLSRFKEGKLSITEALDRLM